MYIKNDGGRAAAGFPDANVGDCVVRAIAIAAQRDYLEVYTHLESLTKAHGTTRRDRVARGIAAGDGDTPSNGVHRPIYDAYLRSIGWVWTSTMGIGTGCQVRLRPQELPLGRLIVSLSRHLVAVVDGIPHDMSDPTRGGRRVVYGFFQAPQVWRHVDA